MTNTVKQAVLVLKRAVSMRAVSVFTAARGGSFSAEALRLAYHAYRAETSAQPVYDIADVTAAQQRAITRLTDGWLPTVAAETVTAALLALRLAAEARSASLSCDSVDDDAERLAAAAFDEARLQAGHRGVMTIDLRIGYYQRARDLLAAGWRPSYI